MLDRDRANVSIRVDIEKRVLVQVARLRDRRAANSM